MSARLLLVTEVPVQSEEIDKTIAAWTAHNAASEHGGSVLYRSIDDADLLVELTPVTGLAEIAERDAAHRELAATIAPALAGDFRRQVVEFVEAPKDTDEPLPATAYIQLRHVEVKPPVHDAYREWRDRTIFDVVRTRRGRGLPGLPLPAEHRARRAVRLRILRRTRCIPGGVHLPRYQDIVKQAGDTYITDRGLYTRIYARVEN